MSRCWYGGGSSSRLEDSRRSQSQENDDDQALDLSTIRSVSCRSIGSSQKFDNMGNFVQIAETERLRFTCYYEHTHVKF
ncbi:hypothetical protein HanXRQr2_Chr06g0269841 [Helianthus annuus]|uniref:Uncharacterized protein n=1 Tax=Helianthus annuus TaxID=4232 RepID=A0A251VPN1_HELAN|nr:hypothetical protein HanXRQr2_Chr06g0269841 [Helianthus annuus]KAJ0567902.1 hypothetical protein HanIR_Chr06g0290081 [Helianthus annuus]KAJ0916337.1 hypothetical protein HanPSC8_Chr06g0260471 [Helianthus annuus]